MNAPISKEEWMRIMLAPARRQPEKSRALPSSAYRDPLESVKLANEIAPKKAKPRKHKPPKVNKKWR